MVLLQYSTFFNSNNPEPSVPSMPIRPERNRQSKPLGHHTRCPTWYVWMGPYGATVCDAQDVDVYVLEVSWGTLPIVNQLPGLHKWDMNTLCSPVGSLQKFGVHRLTCMSTIENYWCLSTSTYSTESILACFNDFDFLAYNLNIGVV